MFLDFALFVFNIKTGLKKSSPVLATEIWFLLWESEMQEVGPLSVVSSECQNRDTKNIGILLIGVFFAVRRRNNVIVRIL